MRGPGPLISIKGGVNMTTTTVNFVSYNSTGFNSIKSNWIRELMSVFNVTFFGLQEHFKKTKSLNSLFKNEFPNYSSYVIPGLRGNLGGRCKGGLAQMCNKSIKI